MLARATLALGLYASGPLGPPLTGHVGSYMEQSQAAVIRWWCRATATPRLASP